MICRVVYLKKACNSACRDERRPESPAKSKHRAGRDTELREAGEL